MKSVVVANIWALLAFNFQPILAKTGADWWENASLYHIYPRSFKDTNYDGVGDLKGITEKIAYLKEIGVTATWLSPVFESPMEDFGYDISNFTRIDPTFGTLSDFDEMLAEAKRQRLKIILDFVPNHSSDACVWFMNSAMKKEGFEDFYVWDDGKVDSRNPGNRLPPSNWISVFGDSMWTWHPWRKQFYLHQFQSHQPDLNFSNPLVRQHMLGVLEYWLDRGVDGFRIDAVPHLFEKRFDNGSYPDEPASGWTADPNDYNFHHHIYTKDQPETVELIYEWRAFLDQYKEKNGGDTRILLGESYSPIKFLSALHGNGTHRGIHMPMNFNLMYLNQHSTAKDVERAVDGWMKVMWKRHKTANWVLGNHDNSRLYNRVGENKINIYNILAQCLPGAAVTYYGEEIGMSNGDTEDYDMLDDSRNIVRTPMQWNKYANAGFTQAGFPWLPVHKNYTTYNVQVERSNVRNFLNVYKGLQKLKKTRAFQNFKAKNGFSYKAVTEQVFQIVRDFAGEEEYRILVNMGNKLEIVENLSKKTYTFVLLTQKSNHKKGDKVNLSDRLYIMPFDAFVLHWSK